MTGWPLRDEQRATPTASASTVNEMLGQAYLRMSAAALILLFGPPAEREVVGRLMDGKLPEDQARAARDGLDRAARKFFG